MSVRRLSKTFISGAGAAAEKSSSFLANYSPAIDEMDLIERVIVGAGGTSSIQFSSIPQTYQHLQIRLVSRSNRSDQNGDFFKMTLNSDSGSNYSWHFLSGNGSSPSALGRANEPMVETNRFPGSLVTASSFGAIVIEILDYANTSKYTTTRQFGGWDGNGSGEIYLGSGSWRNTNAVTSVTLTNSGSLTIQQYSAVSLYGVKA